MTLVSYEGDEKKYYKYKKGKKFYLRCASTTEDENGQTLECNFKDVREDNFKARKQTHICVFVLAPCTNMITKYFEKKSQESDHEQYTLDDLVTKIAILAGQMNLPLTFCESDEFYDLATYFMAFGAAHIDPNQGKLMEQARRIFPHRKRTFYHDVMIQTASSVHIKAMKEFQKLDYVCCAIDQGSVYGRKNVDFVLESPFSTMEPYPYCTLPIQDQTAEGYFPILNHGLGNLELFNIKLGSVVADGNRAQKKCFDITWDGSLRRLSSHNSLKEVIFIPCLCHRVDNALKYHVTHNEDLKHIADTLHSLAAECRAHKEEIGSICPSHVSTRWIYDYDILNFIRMNRQKIAKFTHLPEAFDHYFPILCICKQLILIFESSKTFHFRAFVHLERALHALTELMTEASNPFAEGFQNSLFHYTLRSRDSGVWILSYLLTKKGHDDFNLKIRGIIQEKNKKYMTFFPAPKINHVDQLEETVDDILNDDIIESTSAQTEILPGLDEDVTSTEIGDHSIEEIADTEFRSYLDSAKQFLWQHLQNLSFGETSASQLMNHFTSYLDDPNPFRSYQLDNPIGYSWKQIAMSFPRFRPIADVALRLHHSVCSEASCERMISAQKLILTARRKSSKKKPLDARLTLMRARPRKEIQQEIRKE